MHDLIAITPLGGTEPRVDQVGPVKLSEEPGWALVSVASRLGQEQACADGLKKATGIPAPDVGSVAFGHVMNTFWTGPDQWMVEAPHDSHENLATLLKTELGETASVTEQTDGWCRFDVKGDGVDAVFERLCNVNLSAMTPGSVTRTSIEHLGCYLTRRGEHHLSVIGPRSSAASLHHALLTAMRSAL